MKIIKEGNRLNDVWTGTCYKCGTQVECTTDELIHIFSPDMYNEEVSKRGEVACPVCKYLSVPVTR